MRASIKKFVEICSQVLPIQEPIYEFGSRQVEGQEGFADLRPYFTGKEYVGADISEGKGVDRLLNLHTIDLPERSVGTVICCDTLEHVKHPSIAMEEIWRILRPGGVCIINSVMYFPIHNKPDYWRFTPEGFEVLLSLFSSVYISCNPQNDTPHTVVGVGVKGKFPLMFLDSRRSEWQIRDIPIHLKLLSPFIKLKKVL